MRRFVVLIVLSTLACTGLTGTEEPPPPPPMPFVEIPEPDGPCCDVTDVIEMTVSGVDKAVIIDTINTSQSFLELTSDDVVRMSSAGVDREVIDVLGGGPYDCKPRPKPAAPRSTAPAPEGPPPLNVTVKYGGGRTFELVNLSTREYTGLTLVANSEYQYRLKKLPAGSSDSIRLVSFVSRTNGTELKGEMTSLYITADQGAWSKSF